MNTPFDRAADYLMYHFEKYAQHHDASINKNKNQGYSQIY